MKNVNNQTIKPVGQSTTIAIPQSEYSSFKKVFWKQSVYDFHVFGKTIKNKFIIFEVRSLRVNEFLDILEENDLSWSHINYKY